MPEMLNTRLFSFWNDLGEALRAGVTATMPGGSLPRDIAFTPDGASALVTNRGSGSVSVIDVLTNTVVATIPVASPEGIAVTPDGSRAYVSSEWGASRSSRSRRIR